MFVLSTIPHRTIWGGQRLSGYCEEPYTSIGHLYSVCGLENNTNYIISGPNRGKSLYQFFLESKEMYHLSQYHHFPLVIALVDANQDLSVQVHPDDQLARTLNKNWIGKNESFYFLSAPQSHRMVCGTVCESCTELVERIRKKQFRKIIKTIPVEIDDYVFVPAGTLHALTAGSLVYEIEEASELTFRVYDYDRVDDNGQKRPLHLDAAIKSIKVENSGIVRRYLPPVWIQEAKYLTALLTDRSNYTNESGTLECVTILKGSVTIDDVEAGVGKTVILTPGETIDQRIARAIVARPL